MHTNPHHLTVHGGFGIITWHNASPNGTSLVISTSNSINREVGSSSSCPCCLGHLVSRREEPLFQPSWNECGFSSTTLIPVVVDMAHCGIDELQCLSGDILHWTKGTIPSSLILLARCVLAWINSNAGTLITHHIMSSRNAIADQLRCSGPVISTKRSLLPIVVWKSFQLGEILVLVLFASTPNNKLFQYYSFLPDPLT